jgi:hypothetical protein
LVYIYISQYDNKSYKHCNNGSLGENCHGTVTSEAIACARRCRSSWVLDKKIIIGGGGGGGEASPPKKPMKGHRYTVVK